MGERVLLEGGSDQEWVKEYFKLFMLELEGMGYILRVLPKWGRVQERGGGG